MLRTFGSLWSLTRGDRLRYVSALAAMLAASCLLYLVPLVPVAVIDGLLAPQAEPSWLVQWTLSAMGGPQQVARHPWLPALAILALTSAAGVFTYLRSRWSADASERIVRRLRDTLYDHLQRLPCSYFDRAETGDLLQRATSDVETVRVFLNNQAVEIGRATLMLLVPLPLLLATDVRMTGVALLLMPVITSFSTLFFLRMRSAFEAMDEAESRMTTTLQENLTGIRVVRAFARQSFEIARFAERNATHRALDLENYRLMAVFWSASDLLAFTQQILVVGAGIWWMQRGELAVGEFFYFLTSVGMFMFPLRQMGRILADLGKATVAVGRIREILDQPTEDSPAEPLSLPEPTLLTAQERGRIELDSVSFSYGSGPLVLDRVSLTIEPRTTVAFVGPSGSGKSTLLALLLRLYEPAAGSIRLDGLDLRELDRRTLRRKIGIVMQQPFLFSKSIAENLLLGRADATTAELEAAAQAACVHDTIARFEQGYATEVGERGVMLSGGQRQRLALARALLQEPEVLMLDDALSAVDTRTERAILEQLERRRGRQTLILVAHRLSTVAAADRIFLLEGGRVRELDRKTPIHLPHAPGAHG
jgi:ATP-binding cassette subfamily B protein